MAIAGMNTQTDYPPTPVPTTSRLSPNPKDRKASKRLTGSSATDTAGRLAMADVAPVVETRIAGVLIGRLIEVIL